MSFEKLFDQQEKLYNKIIAEINNSRSPRIMILGKSGCGKTHLTEHIIRNITGNSKEWMILRFSGDIQCIDRDYYPIIAGISNYCQKYNTIKLAQKALPIILEENGAHFFSYITDAIMSCISQNSLLTNKLFTDNELDLLYKIKTCIGKRQCLLYFENIHWWDKKSLDFMYLLIKNASRYIPSLENAVIIGNYTNDQLAPHVEEVHSFIDTLGFIAFNFSQISLYEYKKCLTQMDLPYHSEEIIRILYKITNQNLAITKKALYYHMSPSFILSQNENESEEEFLKILIEKRLDELGATGEQITELLKFASLIGLAFSLLELEHLVSYDNQKIREIIFKANEIALVEPQESLYHFTHEVIRELFRKKLKENNYCYCQKAILCFKTLRPYDYSIRIKYLLKIGDIQQIEKLYCLNLFQQIESAKIADPEYQINILFSEETKEYITLIQKSFQYFKNGNYIHAITIADKIENNYPLELLAARDSLISQCLTKSLSNLNRQTAVKRLEKYCHMENDFEEKQIWAKTMMNLLTAYVHVRDIRSAKDILDKLYDFYGKNAKFCDDYKKELNILRRKVAPFYELEIAAIHLKKSVRFFAANNDTSIIQYPVQYFISLINYSANRISLGYFNEAFALIKTALDLKSDLSALHFPRVEIAINNYLIAGFLSKKMTLNNTIDSLILMLRKIDHIADETILNTNLAAFYLMNLEKNKSLHILESLEQQVSKSECKKFSYLYHIKTNLLIIALIDRRYDDAQNYINELDKIIPYLYQNTYFLKKHELLVGLFQEKKEIPYIWGFHNILLESLSSLQPAWNFYGILPAFNTLEYWSET